MPVPPKSAAPNRQPLPIRRRGFTWNAGGPGDSLIDPARFALTINHMKKGKRGRPATGQNPVVLLTIPAALLKRVDRWRDAQFEDGMRRQEAICRLVELSLVRLESKKRK
jgi:hypothetical protein